MGNYQLTRPLQNAKVMAREKQGKTAEKVMSMGKNPLKNSLFYAILAIAVALCLLSFIQRGNMPSLISVHQTVVKVSFLSEKSAHDGCFLLYFSPIATSNFKGELQRENKLISDCSKCWKRYVYRWNRSSRVIK